ncbi:MAG: hypothetical protein AAB728_04910, partial [Patescibacteria group bacterium]
TLRYSPVSGELEGFFRDAEEKMLFYNLPMHASHKRSTPQGYQTLFISAAHAIGQSPERQITLAHQIETHLAHFAEDVREVLEMDMHNTEYTYPAIHAALQEAREAVALFTDARIRREREHCHARIGEICAMVESLPALEPAPHHRSTNTHSHSHDSWLEA